MRQHLLSERGGENIKYYFTGYLGTSCADKKKKKKKAFIAYSAFVWILQAVKPQQNEKLERVSPGLCAFYILVAFVLR